MSNMIAVPHSIVALVFYALWTIALVLMIGIERTLLVARGHAKLSEFTPGAPHGTDSYWRINRAHMNAAENLAIFAAIVLAGWATHTESHLFNTLAVVVLIARIVQSLIHIMSGSAMAIGFRFTAFGVQLVSQIWMAVMILQTARIL